MRLAIMQPYIFPYIGYFQLINSVDKFVIYDDVNYINKGWINRNQIIVNNKAFLFTVPLKGASQNRLIRDIEVSGNGWKVKFLSTIEMAYKKAPQFIEIFPLIRGVLQSDAGYIGQLAYLSLAAVTRYLELHTIFEKTSAIYTNNNLKSQHRILDICLREGASQYINPIGGQEIYSSELFEKSEIKLNFLETNGVTYKQFGHEFIPNLSIIDVLMFNSKERIRGMLELYELL
jgi:hypothetical protein